MRNLQRILRIRRNTNYVFLIYYADVAQLAEQLICNQQVNGSSPLIGFFLILRSSTRKGCGPLAQLVRATGS